VLDVAFVGVAVLFFAVSIGYVAVCDRLMKWGGRGDRYRGRARRQRAAARVPPRRAAEAGEVL